MDFSSLFSRQPPQAQPGQPGIPDALASWFQSQLGLPSAGSAPNPGASQMPGQTNIPGAPGLMPGTSNGINVGRATPTPPGAQPPAPPMPPGATPPTPPGQPDPQKNLGMTNNSDQMLMMMDPNLKLPLMMGGGTGGGIGGALKSKLSSGLMSLMGL